MARETTPPSRLPPSNPPQASLSGLLFPGQDSRRLTYYHPPGFLTYGLAGSSEEEGRESVGCLQTGRGVAQTWPLGSGSPLECALGSRPPDCIPCVAASPASKCRQEGETWLGSGGVSRQSPSIKTTAGRMQHAAHLQSFDAASVLLCTDSGPGGNMTSLRSPQHSVSIWTTEKRVLNGN